DVGDLDAAPRFQYAPDLGDRLSLVRDEIQDAIRDHDIDALRFDGKRGRVSLADVYVCQPGRGRATARSIAHPLGHVYTDGTPTWADLQRCQQEIGAGARPDVDDRGTWRQRRDRVRVPDPREGLRHAAGNLREFGGVITESSRRVLRSAMEVELARWIGRDAGIDGLYFRAQLEGVEVDGARDGHFNSPRPA